MALTPISLLLSKAIILIIGLLMPKAAGHTLDVTTKSAMTTATFVGIGTSGPIVVTVPIHSTTPSIPTALCGGGLPSYMGFIGQQCSKNLEVLQPGTLPYLTIPSVLFTTLSGTVTTTFATTETTFTTIEFLFTTTITEPPYTVTKTISQVAPSITVTGMCDWLDENIITPCTTVVVATAAPTLPSVAQTNSKSAAIPSIHNPLSSITVFTKRSVMSMFGLWGNFTDSIFTCVIGCFGLDGESDFKSFVRGATIGYTHNISHCITALTKRSTSNKVAFIKGLLGFTFSGGHVNHVLSEESNVVQRRHIADCISIPVLYTPMIMTTVSVINALFLFYAFDVRNPRKAGFATAVYVISFILAYVVVVYVEYYQISVGPVWKQCVQTTS